MLQNIFQFQQVMHTVDMEYGMLGSLFKSGLNLTCVFYGWINMCLQRYIL